MEELRPCPFCGSTPILGGSENVNGHPFYYVHCPNCMVHAHGADNKFSAIWNWNRRPEDEK